MQSINIPITIAALHLLTTVTGYFRCWFHKTLPFLAKAIKNDDLSSEEAHKLQVTCTFLTDDDTSDPPPPPILDGTPHTPTYFQNHYHPLPLRAYPLRKCIHFLAHMAAESPIPPHLHPSDLPAHDLLDIANFLDSPALRDIWARRLLNDMTILNAHNVINSILRHTITDLKTANGLPPIISDAFSRLFALHPLCDNPDVLPDPLAVYRALTTDPDTTPRFQSTVISQWIQSVQQLHDLRLEHHSLLTANDFDCSICSLPGANNPSSQRRFRLPCCNASIHMGCWKTFHTEPAVFGFVIHCVLCGENPQSAPTPPQPVADPDTRAMPN